MKQILLITLIILFPFVLKAQGDIKKTHIEKCKREFKSKMKDLKISDADIHQFCECNAERIFAKFTVEEVKKMDKILQTGTAAEKKEINDKITPIVLPCFTDIQNKIK